jgi:hypothetical protein
MFSLLAEETRSLEDIPANIYYTTIYIELSCEGATWKQNTDVTAPKNPEESDDEVKAYSLFIGTAETVSEVIKKRPEYANAVLVKSEVQQFLPLREAVAVYRKKLGAQSG